MSETQSTLSAYATEATKQVDPDKSKQANNCNEDRESSQQSSAEDTATDSRFDIPDPDARQYLESEAGVTIKESTARTYESRLRIACSYFNDNGTSIREVGITDIREFLKHCAQERNRQKTISGKQGALSSLYKHLELYTEVDLNTSWMEVREIDVSHFQTPDDIKRSAIEDEEVQALFDAMNCRRDKLLAVFAVETGARNRAIRNIKLDHVDLDEKYVKLRDTKGDEWYRMPISNSLCIELRHWIQVERESYTTAKNSDYLFPAAHSEKLQTNNGFCHIILRAAEKAGIQEVIAESPISETQRKTLNTSKEVREWKRVTPHVLRHTFNRMMNDAGLDIEQRRDALNHKSTETTEIYDDGGSEYEETVRDLINSSG